MPDMLLKAEAVAGPPDDHVADPGRHENGRDRREIEAENVDFDEFSFCGRRVVEGLELLEFGLDGQ